MRIENKVCVLRLNSGWSPIGECSCRDALVAMCSGGNEFLKAAIALDVQYGKNEAGEWDFTAPIGIVPTPWEKWIELEVFDYQDAIHTAKRKIRVPKVIIAQNYKKMPLKRFRPTRQVIMERDGYICQYSNRKLLKSEANLDHIHSRARGGKDTFLNLVCCDKRINSIKGDKTPEEAGLKLIRKPFEPLPVPASALIKQVRDVDWRPFLIK